MNLQHFCLLATTSFLVAISSTAALAIPQTLNQAIRGANGQILPPINPPVISIPPVRTIPPVNSIPPVRINPPVRIPRVLPVTTGTTGGSIGVPGQPGYVQNYTPGF